MAKQNRPIQIELVLIILAIGIIYIGIAQFLDDRTSTLPSPTPTPTITATNTPTPTNTPTNTPTPTTVIKSMEIPAEKVIVEFDSGLISPSFEEVEYMAKVIHGEAGICDKLQKSAVAWCVCNRVDWFEYPNTVIEVITQPSQFHGYSPDKEPTAEDYEIAWDVLYRWLNNLDGRTLPKNYLFFHSDHKGKNVFTTNHRKGKVYDWSLPNIYEEEE